MMRFHVVLGCLLLAACAAPEGLRPTPAGTGARVKFDLLAKPLPEIPLPNNLATLPDATSPTGRRVNVGLVATTDAETKIRRKVDQLDGFGIFSPITVPFEAPIDYAKVHSAIAKNHDWKDDPVLLVNVDRRSADYGKATRIDAGQGNYPFGLEWPWQYWDQDEHRDSSNLLFETHEEDVNLNGELDDYEDIDFDGVLDHPNTWSGKDPGPYGIDDLITFYEKETNTLVLWPVVPLRERTTYAVVLTKDLVDAKGEPVRSPFPSINAMDQTPDLEALREVLPDFGRTVDDVQFAWTFTTQSITSDLETVRKGLYGHGPLAALEAEFPPDMEPKEVRDQVEETGEIPAHRFAMPGEMALPLIDALGPALTYKPAVTQALATDSAWVDYWVLGSFTSPSFIADKDGRATKMYLDDDDESWDVDTKGADATRGPGTVTFICGIPKTTAEHKPPFPVSVYGHGFSGAPFEVFGFAGRFAQFGIATCGLDAPGHGLALPTDESIDYDTLVQSLTRMLGLQSFYNEFKGGRIRDLDNDGVRSSYDNGGDFWVWDIFHMRDMVRQAVVDHMQFYRLLRSLGTAKWKADTNENGVADDLMGDWNGDGIVDIGTAMHPRVPTWGQSMGAIISQVLAGVEPLVSASTPVSGGGGLIHIGIRCINPGVPEAVLMPLMGPFVTFSPKTTADGGEEIEIAWMINHLHREYPRAELGIPELNPNDPNRAHYYIFARTKEIKPGDGVTVRNLRNGKEIHAFRHPDGRGFRVSIASDAKAALEKRPLLGLKDGDTRPVPVTCDLAKAPWTVKVGEKGTPEEGKAVGIAECPYQDPERSLLFGDPIEIEIRDGLRGPVKKVLREFEVPVTYEGAYFPAGSRLVAIGTGLGRARNSPELRRLLSIASMIVERGDPIGYGTHYRKAERLDFSYDPDATPQTNMVIYHSVGDPNVPPSTTLALARAAGVLDYLPAEGGGTPRNDLLVGAHVGEGTEMYARFRSSRFTLQDWFDNKFDPANGLSGLLKDARWPAEFLEEMKPENGGPDQKLPVHADPDDTDGGTNEFGEPGVQGYTRPSLHNDAGIIAMRLPYTYPLGAHGVEPSNPTRVFNINNYVVNQIALYFVSGGKDLVEDPCLADSSCSFLPQSVRDHAVP
jgi:hypothetical protein